MSLIQQLGIVLIAKMIAALMIVMGVSGIANTLQFASFRREGDAGYNDEDFD